MLINLLTSNMQRIRNQTELHTALIFLWETFLRLADFFPQTNFRGCNFSFKWQIVSKVFEKIILSHPNYRPTKWFSTRRVIFWSVSGPKKLIKASTELLKYDRLKPLSCPINPHTQKFKTVTYSAVAISGHLTLKNHIFIQVYVSENINY